MQGKKLTEAILSEYKTTRNYVSTNIMKIPKILCSRRWIHKSITARHNNGRRNLKDQA